MSYIAAFILGFGLCLAFCWRRVVTQGRALRAAQHLLDVAYRELEESDARQQRMVNGIGRIQVKFRRFVEEFTRRGGRISGEGSTIRCQSAIAKEEERNSETACAESELRPVVCATVSTLGERTSEVNNNG
jgi:hypothetical protein